ncbi:MAG TPA: alpha-2-macroglobulin, partial [Nitrospirota bacterium]|nr:alpha-2-macroglobulin [Nitrospirota bacterium]
MRKRIFGLIFVFFIGFLNSSFASEPTVEFFSPKGEVKGVRQVTARFTEQMAPFGDPRLVEPFQISCPETGRQRWADGKNWVYDFEHDLPAGVVCEFTLKPDVRTLSGAKVVGTQKFAFSTGGPAVRRSNPYEGSSVVEDQIFILWLDAEPKESTILDNAYCAVDGISERVGIRIITGDDRKQVLSAVSGRHWREEEKKLSELVVQCKQTFPNSSRVTLVWGKGIQSLSNVPTSQDQKLPYRTRPPFAATFSCQRENPDSDCIPFLPLQINFSAPVPWEYASKITLSGPGGTVHRPQLP